MNGILGDKPTSNADEELEMPRESRVILPQLRLDILVDQTPTCPDLTATYPFYWSEPIETARCLVLPLDDLDDFY